MDEMFVPYKEMFESPIKKVVRQSVPEPLTESYRWIWILLGIFLLVLLLFLFYRRFGESRDKVDREEREERVEPIQLPQVIKPEVKKEEIKEQVDYENSQLLAKGVGSKVRDLLLRHKQIPALQVAEIVSTSVRILLGENERAPVTAPISVVPLSVVPRPVQQDTQEKRLPEPRKDGPKVKPPEIVEEEEPKEEPKRGKINAETDPALLKLLKERGLSN